MNDQSLDELFDRTFIDWWSDVGSNMPTNNYDLAKEAFEAGGSFICASVLNIVEKSKKRTNQDLVGEMIPQELYVIAERLRTQDNRMTADPMFCVQEKRRIVGFNPEYTENRCWRDSANDETIYDDDPGFKNPPVGDEWDEYGYIDKWHTVMVAFTEEACKEHLRLNGHNYKETQIYVESFYRCPEMQAIRNWLMNLLEAAKE